jgi:hypothetical protein
MPEVKDILEWCFTLAALDFGVFGFIYSTYASATFSVSPEKPLRPPVVSYLVSFCQVIATILVVLTSLAAVLTYENNLGWATWVLVGCLVLPTAFSVYLALYME